jgi:hypothetical protein
MKTQFFLGVVAAGVLLIASAGFSQAGGWMHKSSGAEKAVSQAVEAASPEFDEEFTEGGIAEPVETGTMSGSEMDKAADTAIPDFDEEFDESGIAEPVETGTLSGSEMDKAADTAIPDFDEEFDESGIAEPVETGTLPSSDGSSHSWEFDEAPVGPESYDKDYGSGEPFLLGGTQAD